MNSLQCLFSDSEVTPEQRLILAIMESGVKEKDVEYFNGDNFEAHCHYLKVDPVSIRRAIKRHWRPA